MKPPNQLSGLVRFLYSQNPFYVISAGLTLYGFYCAFPSGADAVNRPWLLAVSLCGYTSLMAVTAFLVVKFGKVWEDARSIVLILLFQFAAISMSFDRVCATSPKDALPLLLFGFIFSVVVTEGLVCGLGLKFPGLFRGPYYAILALLFFFPLWVSPHGLDTSVNAISWKIYLFPTFAACCFLALIPAARRGAAYVAKNGTPWGWPWFPWTAFSFLALAIGVRSYVLAYSFSLMGMRNAFGGYFLAPLLLALLVLLLEISMRGGYRRLRAALPVVAPLVLIVSIPTGDHFIYARFLHMFTETVGSPVWLALLGLIAFYAYAWYRRLPAAEYGLTATLAVACCVGRATIDWSTVGPIQWWPAAVLGVVQLALSIRHHSSVRCLAASISLVAASTIALRDTPYLAMGGAAPAHLLLALVLLIGLVCRDAFARWLRKAGAVLVAVCAMAAVTPFLIPDVPQSVRIGYAFTLAIVSAGYWLLVKDRWWLGSARANAGASTSAVLFLFYGRLEASVGPGAMVPLAGGSVCFAIAVAISAAKAGLWKRLRSRLPPRFATRI